MKASNTQTVRPIKLPSLLKRRESFTFVLLIIVILVGIALSPSFQDMTYILKSATKYMEFGLVALTMTLVIIAGQIDLSVGSIMACVATFTAMMFHAGMDMGLACVIGLVIAFGFGTFNGILIAYVKLPSMIVTIGTMSLFRGLSQIFIGDASLGKFPEWFNSIEKNAVFKIGNASFSVTILLFIIMSVAFFFILHKTSLGRKIFAIGTNERAAAYSGINTKRIKCLLFSFSGLMAGLAGILTMSRLLLVRFDMASGGELDVITMVLLGGADINGGKGSILGTFLAVIIVLLLKTGLIVANVKAQDQMFVMGLLLLLSIVIPNVGQMIRDKKN
ncbi:MAG: ABC transporter permease [Christensenella sp.]|uniref:ABC transporter permease n=1 Tax=Christensenella sp. TaxID=1935934 RepID=UPI002B217B4A|nr:ABC transporter permease [Christensenella sp.]MEA5004245.1 ABC transporter permease [Christensenella sp.]